MGRPAVLGLTVLAVLVPGALLSCSGFWGPLDNWYDPEVSGISGMTPTDGAAVEGGAPTLSWEDVVHAELYELQTAATRDGVANAPIVQLAVSTYHCSTELAPGQELFWRVRAGDGAGLFGRWSDICGLFGDYDLGDPGPAGGIVFYDKGSYTDGWRYLEAAPADQGYAEWADQDTRVGGTRTRIGSGSANTREIVAQAGESLVSGDAAGCAAKLCNDLVLGGYDDWFLPSKDELDLMYTRKSSIGGFNTDGLWSRYWSSSESFVDKGRAWVQYFSDGEQKIGNKNGGTRVRAVRAF